MGYSEKLLQALGITVVAVDLPERMAAAAAMLAGHRNLSHLTLIIDHNRLQLGGRHRGNLGPRPA